MKCITRVQQQTGNGPIVVHCRYDVIVCSKASLQNGREILYAIFIILGKKQTWCYICGLSIETIFLGKESLVAYSWKIKLPCDNVLLVWSYPFYFSLLHWRTKPHKSYVCTKRSSSPLTWGTPTYFTGSRLLMSFFLWILLVMEAAVQGRFVRWTSPWSV